MAFAVQARDDRWIVSNGPICFGPYRTRDEAAESAKSLNLLTGDGTRPPFAQAGARPARRVA